MTDAWETRQLLFVYGSLLLPTGDPMVDEAMSKSRSLGLGHIHARLYDLGAYPGAKYSAPGASKSPPRVLGRLLAIADPGPFFQVLDRYEGFDFSQPRASEFVRSTTAVTLKESGRTVLSQVYFYSPHTRGKQEITSGDYLEYLQAKERSKR
jgi:gamma-glutamylcyclotransferase (GGCT)/AIG2-like uncharacterized protein YtfP